MKRVFVFLPNILLVMFFMTSSVFILPSGVLAESAGGLDDFDDFDDFNFEVGVAAKIYDPFEKVNRKMFIFNDFADRYFLEYIATGYQNFLPHRLRKMVRNFLHNLSAPLTVVNSVFQGDLDNSMHSLSSFLINSTVGLAGLFNVSDERGISYHQEDLGQTFAKYGLNAGPYLVLPFIGSSNVRDVSGILLTSTANPMSINIFKVGDDELFDDTVLLGLTAISVVDRRENLLKIVDNLRKSSFDLYSAARSAYIQNRVSKINNENKLR
jgi:phospholipid-binding lipoprotein MlaA